MAEDNSRGRITEVIYAASGSKFWRSAGLAVLAVAGLYWFFSWRSRVQDVQLALLRQANAAKQEQIIKEVADLHTKNQSLAQSNQELRHANTKLDGKIVELVTKSRQLTDLANRRVEAIATLPLGQIGADTAHLIGVPETEIQQSAVDSLTFTEPAAKANLRELVLGQTARQQIDLAIQESAFLRSQNSNLEQEAANAAQMLENERQSGKAITASYIMKLGEAHKETAVVKARARKRHIVVGLVGFAVGVVAATL